MDANPQTLMNEAKNTPNLTNKDSPRNTRICYTGFT